MKTVFVLVFSAFFAPLISLSQTVAIAQVVGKDTMATFTLNEVVVITKKNFASNEEFIAFERLKRNTVKVYPYVQMAVKIHDEIESELSQIERRRKQKKYINEREKALREKFEEEIRHLSKNQGDIMIKLINRQTGNNCYNIIKELKGGFTAFIWNIGGKMYDLDLKQEYVPSENPDLELIVRMIESKELPVRTIQ